MRKKIYKAIFKTKFQDIDYILPLNSMINSTNIFKCLFYAKISVPGIKGHKDKNESHCTQGTQLCSTEKKKWSDLVL